MTRHWILNGILAIGLAGCATNGMNHGHEDSEADEKDEVKVPFAQVPANVQAVILRESKGATPASVDHEMKKGKEVYEADVMVDCKNHEIVVGTDGMLVHNKLDEEADDKPAMKKMGKEEDEEDEKPKMK